MSRVQRIFGLCIVFVLIFTLPVLAATSYSEANYAVAPEKISSGTVITEDNIYNVLEYVGLDSSAFIKTDKVNKNIIITVGELEKVIEKSNQMPHTIIDVGEVDCTISEKVTPKTSYPVKTVNSIGNYSNYSIRYSATGKYFVEPPPPHYTYWVEALGGDIEVASCDFPATATITEIRNLTNTLYNGWTPNSYLKLVYDYTVEVAIPVPGGQITITENDISGSRYFYL